MTDRLNTAKGDRCILFSENQDGSVYFENKYNRSSCRQNEKPLLYRRPSKFEIVCRRRRRKIKKYNYFTQTDIAIYPFSIGMKLLFAIVI